MHTGFSAAQHAEGQIFPLLEVCLLGTRCCTRKQNYGGSFSYEEAFERVADGLPQVLLKGNIFFSLISMFSIVMQGHAGDRVELQRRNMEGRGKAYFLGIIVSDLRNGDWLHFEY